MKSEFFKVKILSPVHIGSGEQVDPFHYLIEEQGHEAICHFVDPGAWAADHPDPEELLKIFSGGNIAQMRAYLAENIDAGSYAERSCKVIGQKIVANYSKHLDRPESHNQLLLAPNLIGGGGGPLLPGSSLKGAIRTAVIDWLDQEKKLRLKDCRDSNEQGRALEPYFGKITNNSFQALKIADCEAARNSSLIVEAIEVRRNPQKEVTPKASCEALASQLLGATEQATLASRLVMGRPNEKDACLRLKNGQTLDWSQLAVLVNAYSRKRYLAEQSKFWNQSHFAKTKQALAEIEEVILNPPEGSMTLKVGHYSQIEYVSVEDNRPLTRKTKDGKVLPYGTTRTLADGIYPFGWVLLSPCSEEDYLLIQQQRDFQNQKLWQTQQERRQQRQSETKKPREEARARREALEQSRREREERLCEEAAKPWLVIIRQLQAVENWGDLKQLLEKEQSIEHQTQIDLAQAVVAAAKQVQKLNPDKWEAQRSLLVQQWLAKSGLTFDFAQAQIQDKNLPEDCVTIEALKEFGDYLGQKIDLASLSPEALHLLAEKMKDWGCGKRKAKKNKAAAYQQVLEQLKG